MRREQGWFEETCRLKGLRLGKSYFSNLFATACWLDSCFRSGRERASNKLLLGISGGQGSGKSTFAMLLAEIMDYLFRKRALILAIDDFYLTLDERRNLAASVHPLLATRGVPGTHDIKLMSKVIDDALNNRTTVLPRFSKAEDDRTNHEKITTDSVELIICEGWCWGAQPVPELELLQPINTLEATEDADCIWRKYVNDQLVAYQSLFDTDCSVFLKVPDMDSVVNWRWQQEQDLSTRSVMDQAGVRQFVMYYERISRRMLQQMPDRVDLVFELARDHEFIASNLNPAHSS